MLYYHTPPGDLLQAPPPTADGITEANEKGRELRRVFGALGVPLKFIKGVAAPQIIIWHFDLIKLADFPKIKRLLPTVSAALRCPVVQMSSPLAAVAFALPRTPRQVVHVQSVLTSEEFAKAFNGQSVLPAVVGVSSDNKPILIDFADIPHILIAGTTGSGKSTAANSIITSLLYQSPNRCRLIMIDPKKVEFSIYKDLPHLLAPIMETSKMRSFVGISSTCS